MFYELMRVMVARAGLSPDIVAAAGAQLIDELGLARLSMIALAERLGVKPPSLYKHIGGLADVTHRVAISATWQLAEQLERAVADTRGRAALGAAGYAFRSFVHSYPGRYAAMNEARPYSSDDPLNLARERVLSSLALVLRSYDVRAADEVHALRMIRSSLHGFATLESSGGFQLDTEVDVSFTRLIDFMDRGLRSATK